MPFDSPFVYVYIASAAVLGGLVRGFSGFGASTAYMPIASSVVTPVIATPALLLSDLISSTSLLRGALGKVCWADLRPLFLGAFVGFPLGLDLLTRMDPTVVRWVASAIILTSLGVIASGWKYRGAPSRRLEVGIGFVSGVLSGIAQIGNPPIVVYWLGLDMEPDRMRANLIVYFTVLTMVGILVFVLKGLLTSFVLLIAAVTLPGYAFGMWLGNKLFPLASRETFRKVSFVMIIAAILISSPATDTWFNRR